MNIKVITIGTLCALAVGVVGYGVARYQYSAKLDEAKAAFSSQSTMSAVTGEIVAISGNVLTIRSQARANPFKDVPMVREVTVTESTTIIKTAPLKVGDVVTVDAGRDVATLSSFDAVKITFLGIAVSLPSSVQ